MFYPAIDVYAHYASSTNKQDIETVLNKNGFMLICGKYNIQFRKKINEFGELTKYNTVTMKVAPINNFGVYKVVSILNHGNTVYLYYGDIKIGFRIDKMKIKNDNNQTSPILTDTKDDSYKSIKTFNSNDYFDHKSKAVPNYSSDVKYSRIVSNHEYDNNFCNYNDDGFTVKEINDLLSESVSLRCY